MKSRLLIYTSIASLLIGALLITLELHKTITVQVDGETLALTSWSLRVGNALQIAGIPVIEGDIIDPPAESWLGDGTTVSIKRACWVIITADGESTPLWTTDKNIPNLLDQAKVTINPGDQLLLNGLPADPETELPASPPYSLQIRRKTQINITDGEQTTQFVSTASTLGEALAMEGQTFYNGDQLQPLSETPLEGTPIHANIARSRLIEITVNGQIIPARVSASTVGSALAEAGLSLQGLDYSIPAEDRPLPANGKLRIVRVTEEITIEQEPLPFGVQSQPAPEVDLDTVQVLQVGEYGLTAHRVRVIYEDGIEVSRETENEWMARQPQDRIIGYGTKITTQTASTADGPITYWRAVDVYASTYSPCHSGDPDKCYTHTSSGKLVQKGVIAVTLNWYRYMQGLPVYVPNYGFATIEDVGGGLPDRYWIDLGYSDEDWVGWAGWTTIYFLAPIPDTVMWILE